MNDTVYNSHSLTTVAAALTEAFGIDAPQQADKANPLISALIQNSGIQSFDRVFMYNPDAVALWLYQKYTADYLQSLKFLHILFPLFFKSFYRVEIKQHC